MSEPEPGDIGVIMPSGDHYVFQKLSTPNVGDPVLLVPVFGEYYMLKLTEPTVGKTVIIARDQNGTYYAIE